MTCYTIKELAETWRCSTDVIYDLLRSGKLHGFKVGGGWRISDEARREFEQTPVAVARKAKRRTVLKIS